MSALILRNDERRTVSFTDDAVALRETALDAAALIGRVSNPAEQEAAVEALKVLKGVEKTIEDTREACKEPILKFGRLIDDTAKAFRSPVVNERMRVEKLLADFQQLELAKARAAEAARQRELAELDRKRQEALAQAQTHDERDAINTRADEEAKAAKPAIVPVQAKGQIVRQQWAIRSIREWELAKARPDLVRKIEFDLVAIKALLNAGEKLPGVVAEPEVTSTVRAGRAQVVNV